VSGFGGDTANSDAGIGLCAQGGSSSGTGFGGTGVDAVGGFAALAIKQDTAS
jgi:hypothetical protein